MDYYLGIDLGTSSIKVLVVNRHGEIVIGKTKYYDVIAPKAGWVEQNPQEWLAGLKDALQDIFKEDSKILSNVTAISVTGQMHGIVPVDRKGEELHNAIIWADLRNEEEMAILKSALSNEEWVSITGNQPNISFTLGKILWFKKHYPSLYQKVYKFLLPKDYIRMKLTGKFATDFSDASATLLMDLHRKNWSDQLIDLFSLDGSKLPDIQHSNDIVGSITSKAGTQFFLHEGIPVICGCGDAQAQALGNGVVDSEDWLCTIGTSGQLFVATDSLRVEKNGMIHTLAHADTGKWVLMGATLSAGMSFKWLSESILEDPLEKLLDLASKVNPGANRLLFLPFLFGERSPYMDEKAKGSFIGLTNEHTKAEMCRAVVEGVLLSLYQSFKIIEKTLGKRPAHLIMTGGASQHHVWMETAAHIFNVPVMTKTSRGGGAYGAAMLAATGIGDFKSLEELLQSWGLNKYEQVFLPNQRISTYYEKLNRIYEKSYNAMKGIFHELHDLEVFRKEE